jgi:large subunit ribosomal protein L29
MKSKDEILSLGAGELESKLDELKLEMDNLILQKSTHQITNPMRIRTVRRNIARVKTLISEYQKGIRTAAATTEK